MKKIILLFFILQLSISLSAQTGTWNPPGADNTYPRTLLGGGDIAGIQSILDSEPFYSLYSGVIASANATPPVGNTTDAERLSRSHIAKNAAFIALMNRKIDGGSIVALTQIERDAFVAKAITLLESINTSVGAFPIQYDTWQWRSKELIDYISAYDLLMGISGVPALLPASEIKVREFAGNLYSAAITPFFGQYFFNLVKNNHAIKTAAAFGMAAVVLNNTVTTNPNEYPLSWINTAMWNIDNVFFRDALRMTEPGEFYGYAESPYYLRYAGVNFLPFFRALGNFIPDGNYDFTYSGNTRTVRHPYYDPDYDSLYVWAKKIRMPDGRMPVIEDTYVNKLFPELALTGKQEFNTLSYYTRLPFSQTLSSHLLNANTDLRANYIAAGLAPQHQDEALFLAEPNSGNLIFRSSTDSAAFYFHVNAKHGIALSNSGGHNQGDASSFLLYDRGYIMALDPGYVQYERRDEVGTALQHNLILVDGAGPQMGVPGSPNDANAYIENSRSTPFFNYAEVRTSYGGANIVRKFMHFGGRLLIVADFVSSASTHSYQWRLHGNGITGGDPLTDGSFIEDFANYRGTWTYKDVSLLANTITAGGTGVYSTGTQPHEVSYNLTANHTVMQLEKSSVQSTVFLSLLSTYTSAAPVINTLATSPAALLSYSEGGQTGYIMTDDNNAPDSITASQSGLEYSVITDAALVHLLKSDSKAAALEQLFLQEASEVRFGAELLISADSPADFTVSNYLLPDSVSGEVFEAASLEFELTDYTIDTVTGSGISSFVRLSQNRVRVEFGGEGNFLLTASTTLNRQIIANTITYISLPVEPRDGFTVPAVLGGTAPYFMEGNGGLYIPDWGLSTLLMDRVHGYKIYHKSNVTLSFSGNALNGGYTVTLPESTLTLIGYPYAVSQAAASLFGGYSSIKYADDDEGNLYIPDLGINTLTLEPGKGYRVYTDALIQNFSFPVMSGSPLKSLPAKSTFYSQWDESTGKGEPYPVLITAVDDFNNLLEGTFHIYAEENGKKTGEVKIEKFMGIVPLITRLADDGLGLQGAAEGSGITLYIEANGKKYPCEAEFSKGGTYGSGLYSVCRISLQNELPLEYALAQNFPNPFNPVTAIRFTLPEQSRITLSIFNVLGERVEVLAAETLPAGEHQYRWDASVFPSGVYFYRLETSSFTGTKKMLLLR